jgi:hypothetical protein
MKKLFSSFFISGFLGLSSLLITQTSFSEPSNLLDPSVPINSNFPAQGINNFDKTGVIQQFNNGLNSLSQPNCSSPVCLFSFVRNSTQGTEILGGAIWQLGSSPSDTQAEAQKLLAIAQKEKIDQESTLILTDKLAEAIEAKKMERAKLYAISLAKRLGYSDYRQLLKEISNSIE